MGEVPDKNQYWKKFREMVETNKKDIRLFVEITDMLEGFQGMQPTDPNSAPPPPLARGERVFVKNPTKICGKGGKYERMLWLGPGKVR